MYVRVLVRLGALLAIMAGVFGVQAAGDGETPMAQELRIAEVAVTIDDTAFVDWNRPSTTIYCVQNDIMRQVFHAAALDGAERSLVGQRPAVLAINIT